MHQTNRATIAPRRTRNDQLGSYCFLPAETRFTVLRWHSSLPSPLNLERVGAGALFYEIRLENASDETDHYLVLVNILEQNSSTVGAEDE